MRLGGLERTLALAGALLVAVSVVAGLAGVVEATALLGVLERVWEVLLFVVGMSLVAECAGAAGLFAVIGAWAVKVTGGRPALLWAAILALIVGCTILLSLDTTAVLVTPVAIALARQAGLPPLPYALATVWLANTASLLLPVSNLTNLLALDVLPGVTPLGYAALMVLPALVGIVLPVAALTLIFRRELFRREEHRADEYPALVLDPVLLGAASVVVALLVPGLLMPIPLWIPAITAAAVLVPITVIRRRSALGPAAFPWPVLVFVTGLFLAVEVLAGLGLDGVLAQLVPTGDGAHATLPLAGLGTLAANLVNNLPAYVVLEPLATSPARVAALLVGVNAGPLIAPWASLATLLWHQRLRAEGVEVSWRRFALLGLVMVPPTVALGALAVAL